MSDDPTQRDEVRRLTAKLDRLQERLTTIERANFNGDDHCENGHAYPSKSALTSPPPDTTPTKVALPPVRTYSIMSDAVERGIAYGYNRAHKHTDKPAEETIRQQIHDAVMLELTEVFDFGDEGDES